MTEKCDKCGKEFDSERGLHIHQAQKHKKEENEESEETSSTENQTDNTDNLEFKVSQGQQGLTLNIKQVGYGSFAAGLLAGLLLGALVFGFSSLDDARMPSTSKDATISIDTESYDAGLGSSEDSFNWEGGEVNLTDRSYIGNPEANITVVSYEDFTCIWCSRHNTERAFPQLFENEIADGDIQYFYRHFPRNSVGQDVAEASECILNQDTEKFWKAKEYFFENHRRIIQGEKGEVINEAIQGLEINQDEFNSCRNSENAGNMVSADQSEASEYDYSYTQNGQERQFVAATPSFLIHNHETGETHAEAGAIPYRQFQEHINS